MMPGGPITRTEKKESESEQQRQNRIPVIAKTWWKKLLHKFFSLALKQFVIFTDALFQVHAYF